MEERERLEEAGKKAKEFIRKHGIEDYLIPNLVMMGMLLSIPEKIIEAYSCQEMEYENRLMMLVGVVAGADLQELSEIKELEYPEAVQRGKERIQEHFGNEFREVNQRLKDSLVDCIKEKETLYNRLEERKKETGRFKEKLEEVETELKECQEQLQKAQQEVLEGKKRLRLFSRKPKEDPAKKAFYELMLSGQLGGEAMAMLNEAYAEQIPYPILTKISTRAKDAETIREMLKCYRELYPNKRKS